MAHDDALKDRIVELWLRGASASVVAKAVSTEFRVNLTRNAVIGIVTRLGHKRGAAAAPKAAAPSKPKPAKPPKPVVVVAPLAAVPPAPKPQKPDVVPDTARPWVERERGQCNWPITVDGETWSCCAPAEGTYCLDHRAIAFTGRAVVSPAVRRDLKRYA